MLLLYIKLYLSLSEVICQISANWTHKLDTEQGDTEQGDTEQGGTDGGDRGGRVRGNIGGRSGN